MTIVPTSYSDLKYMFILALGVLHHYKIIKIMYDYISIYVYIGFECFASLQDHQDYVWLRIK